MNIIKQTNLSLFLLIIVFCCSPIQAIFASTTPVEKEKTTKTKQQKRVKNKLRKKLKKVRKKRFMRLNTQEDRNIHWIWWFLIIWYGITLALLIIGLSLAIPPLWILAIVLLCLPILAFLIFAIIFFVALMTTPWG